MKDYLSGGKASIEFVTAVMHYLTKNNENISVLEIYINGLIRLLAQN